MDSPSNGQRLSFGLFEADLSARELRKRGHRIRLQDQPFQLLSLLLERSGEVAFFGHEIACNPLSDRSQTLTINLLTNYKDMLYWFLICAPPARHARQVVLQTPSESLGFTELLSRQQFAPVSPLTATLVDFPATVANKRVTVGLKAGLTPLAATFTKNRGGTLQFRLALSTVRERFTQSVVSDGSAERPFVTSLLPHLFTSSFLLTRSHFS